MVASRLSGEVAALIVCPVREVPLRQFEQDEKCPSMKTIPAMAARKAQGRQAAQVAHALVTCSMMF
jgi:hypothetical protein